jgi:hypothetical protein
MSFLVLGRKSEPKYKFLLVSEEKALTNKFFTRKYKYNKNYENS